MSPEVKKIKNPKSCFLNLSYTSGDSTSKIERIITNYFRERRFEVKTGRMTPAGEKTDKGILQVIKSCGFGIVVYNELRHNISYEWGLMDALGVLVIPFRNKDMHIDIGRDFSDKKGTTFIFYSGDLDEGDIITELENSDSLKAAIENVKRFMAEQISSDETDEAKEASKLLIESDMPLGEFGLEIKEENIKDINEIIDALNKVKNLTVEGHFNKATAYYYAKRYEEAELELREVLRINPDLAEAHNNLGVLLYNLERYEEAEDEYREAIRIDPDDAAAHNNFGNLLKDLERYDEAGKEYGEAIRIDPDLAEAHYNLGNLLKNLKRYDEAEKEYGEAIRIDPDYAEAHNNLGNLLKNLKRYDEAEKEYGEAIRINPDYAEVHGNLGNLFSETKRPEEAKIEFEIAKALFAKQGRDEIVKKVEELLEKLK